MSDIPTKKTGLHWLQKMSVAIAAFSTLSLTALLGLRTFSEQSTQQSNYSDKWYIHTEAEPCKKVSDFRLIDQHGNSFGADNFSGELTLVRFYYSRCKTVCPGVTAALQALANKLSHDNLLENIQIVSISLDPAHDTQEMLLNTWEKLPAQIQPYNILLTDPLATKTPDYNPAPYTWDISLDMFTAVAATDKELIAQEGPIIHNNLLILVDHQGRIRGLYAATQSDPISETIAGSPDEIDLLIQDIKAYLLENTTP